LKLRYAVKIAAVRAVYTQLGVTTQTSVSETAAIKAAYTQLGITKQTSVSATAGIFRAQRLGASIQTLNRIVASVQEGNFMLFAALFDTFYIRDGAGASDAAVFNFFKTLTDDAGVAEEATNSFMKALAHTATLGDEIDFFAFGKSFQNTSAVAEAYAAHIQKTLSDGFSVAEDAASLRPHKSLFEAPAAADEINNFGVGKASADAPLALDAHSVSSGKLLTNTSAAADEINNFDVGKASADAPLALDAHAVSSSKPLTNTSAAADEINTFGVGKASADAPLALDAHAVSSGKLLTNTSAAADAPSKEPGKVLNDIVTEVDDQTILFTMKAPDNPVGAVDGVSTKGVGKSAEDFAVSLDQAARSFGKDVQDIFAAVDEINSFSTSKQIVDSIFVTDDVDGAASILDDQEMQFVKQHTDVVGFSDLIHIGLVFTREFIDTGVSLDSVAFAAAKALADGYTVTDVINVLTGKHFSDIFSASETLTKAVSAARIDSALLGDAHAAASSKVLFDTPLLADAGSLRSQGYCDFAYFAEDYVGASRTFT